MCAPCRPGIRAAPREARSTPGPARHPETRAAPRPTPRSTPKPAQHPETLSLIHISEPTRRQ
ncbi:hypothetical protein FRIG_12025, partial [Frigoribacterium faeni]|nr:hypothetical protein [Frigoribacterium faeni]